MYLDYLTAPEGSPLGFLQIQAIEAGITHIDFVDECFEPVKSHPRIDECKTQLEEYFQGQRQTFDVPLAPEGTVFQQRVWRQLRAIAFGETCSYAAISQKIDSPNSHRAVGAANGRNPVSIIVPCHRVIGSNGQLTGYAGGLARKQWLLCHEQAHREFALQPS
ncbi:methylated-DNA--[protein]-cysteine S-methyltransferase [Halomonas sp. PR-M31]|uniref:methylated-DNA--[protein]-cysteine S-methyltransferase n=1 Tax=Halomonas sp. PR-M31 TaxID=1471202 RepID=UPI0006503E40|nr:methylated-DNA--[protein]-cysteine S-methyltransferase [Halomonas sp. PR-M31]